jgi:hypothetical protein
MSVAEGRTDGGRTEGRRSGLRGVIWSLVVGVGSTMAERNQILPEFIEGGDPTVCSTCSISWTFFFSFGTSAEREILPPPAGMADKRQSRESWAAAVPTEFSGSQH